MLGREADWDRLPRNTVIYASQGRLPDAFAPWADQVEGEHAHGETDRDIASDGKDWRVSMTPLQDASGRDVGDLLVMRDISTEKAAFARLLALSGMAGAVLLGFICVVLRRTDADIRAQQAKLRESEGHYRGLFEHMAEGYAYCRMIFENGEPQDFIYLAVNTAFETLTGLRNITGKKVSEVIPGLREADPQLFVIYARVSLTGKPEKFEMFVEPMKMWFSVAVYSPGKGCFVAMFDVITARKQAEEELRERTEALQAINGELEAQQLMMFAQTREMRALLDGMPGHSFLKARNGQYLAANQMFCQALGKTEELIIGATDMDLFPPDLARKRLADDQQVFSAEIPMLETEDLIIRGQKREWMLTRNSS